MFGWLRRLAARLRSEAPSPRSQQPRGRRHCDFERSPTFTVEPRRQQWSPCHPSTAKLFKASLTCPNGHTLTLRNHSVADDGYVSPSVVCPERGCDFHEWVRLRGWKSV